MIIGQHPPSHFKYLLFEFVESENDLLTLSLPIGKSFFKYKVSKLSHSNSNIEIIKLVNISKQTIKCYKFIKYEVTSGRKPSHKDTQHNFIYLT